jgi:hypothetical protein
VLGRPQLLSLFIEDLMGDERRQALWMLHAKSSA